MSWRIREAVPADVPHLVALVRELAEYEREPDAVEATEEHVAAALFGDDPRVHAFVAELVPGGNAGGEPAADGSRADGPGARGPSADGPSAGEPDAGGSSAGGPGADGRGREATGADGAGAGRAEPPTVVGMAVWYVTFSTWLGRHGIWLEDLYVRPDQRGTGVGTALLRVLARTCVERGYGRLEWWVLRWNLPSIGFYGSLGAEPMEEWQHYRLDGRPLRALAGLPTGPGG